MKKVYFLHRNSSFFFSKLSANVNVFVFIIDIMMHMNKSEAQLRQKIREEILKNKDVTDLRIIDMLVFKVILISNTIWSQF